MSQHEIRDMAESQAQEIAASLVAAKVYLPDRPDLEGDALRNHLAKTEVVALIAYIQKLGAYRDVVRDEPIDLSRPQPVTNR
jgi:cbb3-type cytochrome oxidase cytochrome c subunit